MSFGVYRILNCNTGRQYIGATGRSFAERWREHLYDLRSGTHHNKALQKDWDVLGEERFRFERIEVITDVEALGSAEQAALDGLSAVGRYNYGELAATPMSGVPLSDEHRRKLSEFNGSDRHPMLGKNHTLEARARMSASRTGKKRDDKRNGPDLVSQTVAANRLEYRRNETLRVHEPSSRGGLHALGCQQRVQRQARTTQGLPLEARLGGSRGIRNPSGRGHCLVRAGRRGQPRETRGGTVRGPVDADVGRREGLLKNRIRALNADMS